MSAGDFASKGIVAGRQQRSERLLNALNREQFWSAGQSRPS